MKNTEHKPMNTDFTDGQLALINELLDFMETNPTAQEIRKDFISPKCKEILEQITEEKKLLASAALSLPHIHESDKSLFEIVGEICRPENFEIKNNQQ